MICFIASDLAVSDSTIDLLPHGPCPPCPKESHSEGQLSLIQCSSSTHKTGSVTPLQIANNDLLR